MGKPQTSSVWILGHYRYMFLEFKESFIYWINFLIILLFNFNVYPITFPMGFSSSGKGLGQGCERPQPLVCSFASKRNAYLIVFSPTFLLFQIQFQKGVPALYWFSVHIIATRLARLLGLDIMYSFAHYMLPPDQIARSMEQHFELIS